MHRYLPSSLAGSLDIRLVKTIGRLQSGAVSGGGVEGPSLAIRMMVVHSPSVGVSLGLLLVDIRATVYSVLAEEVLDTMLTPQSRAVALGHVGFTAAQCLAFEVELCRKQPKLLSDGLHAAWSAAIRDWHCASWFRVPVAGGWLG